jgi:ribonuclease HI
MKKILDEIIDVWNYMDDILILGKTKEEVIAKLNKVKDLCKRFGFIIKEFDLSEISNRINFLGREYNLSEKTTIRSRDRVNKLVKWINSKDWSKPKNKRFWYGVMGRLNYLYSGRIIPQKIKKFYKVLSKYKWNEKIKELSNVTKASILKLVNESDFSFKINDIVKNKVMKDTLYVDASSTGIGIVFKHKKSRITSYRVLLPENELRAGDLELLGFRAALKLMKKRKKCSYHIITDSPAVEGLLSFKKGGRVQESNLMYEEARVELLKKKFSYSWEKVDKKTEDKYFRIADRLSRVDEYKVDIKDLYEDKVQYDVTKETLIKNTTVKKMEIDGSQFEIVGDF